MPRWLSNEHVRRTVILCMTAATDVVSAAGGTAVWAQGLINCHLGAYPQVCQVLMPAVSG